MWLEGRKKNLLKLDASSSLAWVQDRIWASSLISSSLKPPAAREASLVWLFVAQADSSACSTCNSLSWLFSLCSSHASRDSPALRSTFPLGVSVSVVFL